MAACGAGTCSLVPDASPNLNEIVITALTSSLFPALKGCAIKWQHEDTEKDLGSVIKD